MMYEVVLTRNDTGTGKPTLRYFIVKASTLEDARALALDMVPFFQHGGWNTLAARLLGEVAVEVLGQVELI